jgi:hypothetical protein
VLYSLMDIQANLFLEDGYSKDYIKILSDCERAEELGFGLPSREGIVRH